MCPFRGIEKTRCREVLLCPCKPVCEQWRATARKFLSKFVRRELEVGRYCGTRLPDGMLFGITREAQEWEHEGLKIGNRHERNAMSVPVSANRDSVGLTLLSGFGPPRSQCKTN